ncbi:MAG: AAA family ATPase, partial [Thermoanaerobaculia bacterium]|nr:AAA family ATPase [Thermoanaerobaculia bacterium]
MISYLRIRNLAIVDKLEMELERGLNVLTGETGAGKSLLIDSLQFLSGARGSTDVVRSGEDRLSAEAVVLAPEAASPLLDDLAIDYEIDEGTIELVIRRELRANGRGRVLVNGSITTVRDLQSLMDLLIEIHGQKTTVQRIGGRSYREMLDEWTGSSEEAERTRRTFASWKETSDALDELRNAQRDRVQRLDMLEFQIRELTAADLDPDEEEELRRERDELAHAEDLAEAVNVALELISENEDAAISLVGRASDRLERIARKVESLRPTHEETEDALIRLQEIARSLSSVAGSIRHDPARLDEVE